MERLIKKQLRKNSQTNTNNMSLKSRQKDSFAKFRCSKSLNGTQKLMTFATSTYTTSQNTHRQKLSVERILQGKDRATPSFGLDDIHSEYLYKTIIEPKGDRLSHGLTQDTVGKPVYIEDQRFNTAEKTNMESLKSTVIKSTSRNNKLSTDISEKSVIVFELTPSQLYKTQGYSRINKRRNNSTLSYTTSNTLDRGISKFIKKTKRSLSKSQASMKDIRSCKLKTSQVMKPKKTVRINFNQLAGF